MNIKEFEQNPFMGILRGIEADILEPLIETVVESGLETIEIAMNTRDAPALIKQAVKLSKGRLTVGAGTVLTDRDLKSALEAGATFIVSPTIVDEVVEYCAKNKIPVFPGALTPGEIYEAWEKGASMVKVFPAKLFGPQYMKEIRAPFQEIKLMACGGVTEGNIGEYFSAGANAIAFGASIFKKKWLFPNKLDEVKKSIQELRDRAGITNL